MLLCNVFSVLMLSIFSYASCSDRAVPAAASSDVMGDSVYHFNLRDTSVAQPFDPSIAPPAFTHVQVVVLRVVNTQLHPVSFDVFFQPRGGTRFILGTFSLYPADHPGKFIVPAQGKVKGDGELVLTLRVPGGITDCVEVVTGKMELVK